MKKIVISTFFTLTAFYCLSQQEIPFSKNKQFYLNGGSTIIGNNSVSKHSKKPFNDLSKINDEIKMVYVDVDNDDSTFSSSQASLELPTNSKVKYATIYWSAIYSFNKGVKKRTGNRIIYKGNNQRDDDFNTIKIKAPNKNYVTIKGDILFDGYKLLKYKENAPYVCAAEITHLFNDNNQVNGTFTVANINATQGFISGGSAAGWFIYIVYENDNEPLKAITTYNGLNQLNKKPEIIQLKDFRTIKEGSVKANITLAALEGDIRLKTDECLIKNTNSGKLINLESQQRPKNNFFNGTISNKSNSLKRYPNSKNTLGFDVLQLEISNENNTVINNNAEQVDLHLKTIADRFFLYFAAFETEIDRSYLTDKESEPVNSIQINEDLVVNNSSKKSEPIYKGTNNQESINIKSLKNINAENGYYLITNVFSKPYLAKKWIQFLIDKGYNAKSFINPENNWEYVYIRSSESIIEVRQESNLLNKVLYFEGLWICKID